MFDVSNRICRSLTLACKIALLPAVLVGWCLEFFHGGYCVLGSARWRWSTERGVSGAILLSLTEVKSSIMYKFNMYLLQ